MDNAIFENLTDRMLQRQRILSIQTMQEVNEVDGAELPPCLHIKYENGREEWIKGENEINKFINNIIANK